MSSTEKVLSNIKVFERECAGAVSTGICGCSPIFHAMPTKALVTRTQARRSALTRRRCSSDAPPGQSVSDRK
ncbi:hypothetical protein LY78DRAFT_657492 [Colletotrichum sublineola]|nr:hypothetical protein LY78DRAFT_657492 [Colletotrichum sublineola]